MQLESFSKRRLGSFVAECVHCNGSTNPFALSVLTISSRDYLISDFSGGRKNVPTLFVIRSEVRKGYHLFAFPIDSKINSMQVKNIASYTKKTSSSALT